MLRKTVGYLSCLFVVAIASVGVSHAEKAEALLTKAIKTGNTEASPTQVARVTNVQSMVTLQGQVHPLAAARYDRGAVADSMPLSHMVLVLQRSPEQDAALTTLIDQLHDPKSPMYHRWLTPEEFGQYFGPSDQEIQQLTSWLESNGFKVDEVSPGKATVIFSGTAAQVRQAFRTQMHTYNVYGENHVANSTNPQIPAAFGSMVVGFRALHNFQAKPLHHMVGAFAKDKSTGEWKQSSPLAPNLTSVSGPLGDARLVGPQDFYTIYNLKPLLSAGINGAGQTIAVIEQSDVNPADVTAFRSQFGLPAYPATPNAASGGVNYFKGVSGYCADPGVVASGDEAEAILDVEWAGAIAPNATVDVVSCASSNISQGTDLALTYIVNHLSSSVSAMSYSYGACEASLGSASNAFYKSTYQQAVAQGQTVVVSAGDSGAAGCDYFTGSTPSPSTMGNAVNGLASTPYNIAAGGTDFTDTYQNLTSTYWSSTNKAGYESALSYVPETAWNGTCASPLLLSYASKLGLNPGATNEAWCNNKAFVAKYGSFVFLDGAGGGVSSLYAKPSWQSAYGVPNDAKRDIPDISLFASNFIYSHALAVCQSDLGYACDMSNSTAAQTMAGGGTSFVAPQIAGLIALVNQKTNERQGQANYTLYALAASEYGSPTAPKNASLTSCNGSLKGNAVGTSCMFYDVNAVPKSTSGTIADTISQPCAAGTPNCVVSSKKDAFGLLSSSAGSQVAAYPTGKGYDLATGLGSINFANLVNSWTVGATSGPSTFTTTTSLTASPTTIPFGGVTTLTATVTNSTYASPVGVVNFYSGSATGSLLGTATLVASKAPVSVAALQVTGLALGAGPSNIVAVFPGDGANDAASASAAVTINVGLTAQGTKTTTLTLTSSTASILAVSNAAATISQQAVLTATVTGGVPDGSTVTFKSATGTLGTATTAAGVAKLTIDSKTTGIALASNSLTAAFAAVTSGGNTYTASNSNLSPVTFTAASGLNVASFGSVAIGNTSAAQTYSVIFTAATTVGTVSALTQGVSSTVGTALVDYVIGSGNACANTTYIAGARCVLSIAFEPTVSGTRLGAAALYDGSGAPIISLPTSGIGQGPLLSFGQASPSAMALSGMSGPTSVAVDPSGALYVADILNNRVVKIANGSTTMTPVGGTYSYPISLALDGAGNLYVVDSVGLSVVNSNSGALSATAHTAITVGGTALKLASQINFDNQGNLYIADTYNNRVLKVTRSNGALNFASPTLVGSGYTYPQGVAVDSNLNVFIADTGFPQSTNGLTGRLVEVTSTGVQSTINIPTYSPFALAADSSGGLYVAEGDTATDYTGSSQALGDARILQLSPDLSRVSTLLVKPAGSTNMQVWGGLGVDLKGNVWAPDFNNNQIVTLNNIPSITFPPAFTSSTSAPVANIGNTNLNFYSFAQGEPATLSIFGFSVPDNTTTFFTQQNGTGNCMVGTPVAPSASCNLVINFNVGGSILGLASVSAPFYVYDNINNQANPGHQETMQLTGGLF